MVQNIYAACDDSSCRLLDLADLSAKGARILDDIGPLCRRCMSQYIYSTPKACRKQHL